MVAPDTLNPPDTPTTVPEGGISFVTFWIIPYEPVSANSNFPPLFILSEYAPDAGLMLTSPFVAVKLRLPVPAEIVRFAFELIVGPLFGKSIVRMFAPTNLVPPLIVAPPDTLNPPDTVSEP